MNETGLMTENWTPRGIDDDSDAALTTVAWAESTKGTKTLELHVEGLFSSSTEKRPFGIMSRLAAMKLKLFPSSSASMHEPRTDA